MFTNASIESPMMLKHSPNTLNLRQPYLSDNLPLIVEPDTIINAPGINIKLILAGDIPKIPWRKIGIRNRIPDIPMNRMNLDAIPILKILFWNIRTSNSGVLLRNSQRMNTPMIIITTGMANKMSGDVHPILGP